MSHLSTVQACCRALQGRANTLASKCGSHCLLSPQLLWRPSQEACRPAPKTSGRRRSGKARSYAAGNAPGRTEPKPEQKNVFCAAHAISSGPCINLRPRCKRHGYSVAITTRLFAASVGKMLTPSRTPNRSNAAYARRASQNINSWSKISC
jgi:hypothetical protein